MIELSTHSVLKCSGTGKIFELYDVVELLFQGDGDERDLIVTGKIVVMDRDSVTIDSSEKYKSKIIKYNLKEIDEMTKVQQRGE